MTPAYTDRVARDAVIREAQSRVIARLKSDPKAARTTLVTIGRIDQGLACTVDQGRFSATTDLGRGMGGDAAGPPPGFFARTAIVGCVGMAIKMLAAREGLAFGHMEIAVETDFDDGALFGLGDASAAPLRTRIKIAIESRENPDAVSDLVDRALRMDPWFLALRDAQIVKPMLSVTSAEALPAAS